MIERTREEIAWIAGLLEGEGCFSINNKYDIQPQIHIRMTDLDVIERARSILGGNCVIREEKRNNKNSKLKNIFNYSISSSKLALEWMHILYPWMGRRRQSKIRQIIEL